MNVDALSELEFIVIYIHGTSGGDWTGGSSSSNCFYSVVISFGFQRLYRPAFGHTV